MIIVDAHCDTAFQALDHNADLYENSLHLDLKRLLATGQRVQFFAAFADPVKYMNNTLSRVLSILDVVCEAEEKYRDKIAVCRNASDIDLALARGKVAALLSVEGGECLNGDLAILRQLFRLGVRSMLLTWNYRNLLADGAQEYYGSGLSAFGRKVVAEMERLGMIVDVSHLCEASFYDVLEISKKPVIASHSNAKAVCDNIRNLSDCQLASIKANGGVVGINFCPSFLNNTDNTSVDDIIKHIEHICSVTGEDHIGIGSDFDGIVQTPLSMEGTQCIPALFERLAQLNYSDTFIEKFAGLNFLRIIRQILN
ncbi:MAG: dipeptidase [Acetivibrionales bacterium]